MSALKATQNGLAPDRMDQEARIHAITELLGAGILRWLERSNRTHGERDHSKSHFYSTSEPNGASMRTTV